MSLWMLFVMLGLIKLPIAVLMMWMPFRHDEAMCAPEVVDSSEEDGGSHMLPAGPRDPHPRMPLPHSPRRGPHGAPALPPPARIRTSVRAKDVKSIR